MKKGDWVLFLQDGLFESKWIGPFQLEHDPVMGWMTGEISKFFISAEVHPMLEQDLGKPTMFYINHTVPRGFNEFKYIPANRVRKAVKKDFDPLIEHVVTQKKNLTKDWKKYLAARRRVGFI